ncbi:MAG TPA: O-antigen ligase family protein [Candidatus Paceibacterota bacterium]
MTGLVTWLHYLSLFFVISALFTEEKEWQKIFRAIILSGAVLAVVSFLGADGLSLYPFSLIKEGGSLFGNTSYSGAYYLLVFFISLIGLSLERARVWRAVYMVCMIAIFFTPELWGAFSGLGLARASTLVLWGGILILLFLFVLHKFTTKKVTITASILLLVFMSGTLAYGLSSVLNQEGRVYEAYQEKSGSARVLVWNIALTGIKERPILGYGPENFSYVFQQNFNPEIIRAEASTEWFDNAHNFTLSQMLEAGALGSAIFLALSILILLRSLKLYFERGKFYFVIIPFILFFHLIQTQTFFQTDSTLFLVFILLAFLVSHEGEAKIYIPFTRWWPKLLLAVLFLASFYFFIVMPTRENLLISKIAAAGKRPERFALNERLSSLHVYPSGALRLTSGQFLRKTALNSDEIRAAGLEKNVAEEYRIYLDAYEKYMPRYENNYRYLMEYANIINTAFTFRVDELKRGEDVARQALQISELYPHAYWVLAVNLYYQGRQEEALVYAKAALTLDPTLEKSKEIYEIIKN